MPRYGRNALAHTPAALALLCTMLLAGPGAYGQGADRERAQMLQLQQQLQRLERERSDLQSKAARDGDELKKLQHETEGTRRDLARVRTESNDRAKEIDALREQLNASREALTAAKAEIDRLTQAVAERDSSLATAARAHHEQEQAQSLLGERLKAQTSRGDLCETKHEQAVALAKSAIDAYEKDRLRLCEPVTGIWRVRSEEEIQKLRDGLYESRLDVPIAKVDKTERAPAAQ